MRGRRRLLISGSIAAVVVAGVLGGRALADSSSQVASFRTATARRATVTQTQQRSGIIEPVAAGTVAFPISGAVTAVSVQPGQTVTTGQTLATLDTSALQAQLTAQQAQLAAAQLTLNNALNGVSTPTNGSSSDTSSGSSSASRSSSTASSGTSGRSSGSGGGASTSVALGPARQAVASGQQRVDGALSAAQTALGAASSSCGSPSKPSPSSTTSTTSSTSSSSSTSSTTSTTAPPSPQGGASQQCTNDLQSALDAQQQLAAAQADLAKAESTLDSMLASATPSGSSGQQATGTSTAAASTPSLSGPTSAELVADQAAADAAQANVTAAQQDLAQGAIVSPIDGTVAAVNMKVGDHVGAASSTENIVVVGPGGYEVTTTVPVTDIGKVKLADAASVVPDGSGSAIDGKVVSIGVVPTTSGTTTAYPVVIGLNGSPDGLRNGGDASVTITLNQVNDVLAVPTSAVRTAGAGAFHIVLVLTGSTTRTTPVQVGAIGPELTQITSGLQEGQQVVIADLNAPLPSNTTTRLGSGGGAFGSGGGAFGSGGLGGVTIGRGG